MARATDQLWHCWHSHDLVLYSWLVFRYCHSNTVSTSGLWWPSDAHISRRSIRHCRRRDINPASVLGRLWTQGGSICRICCMIDCGELQPEGNVETKSRSVWGRDPHPNRPSLLVLIWWYFDAKSRRFVHRFLNNALRFQRELLWRYRGVAQPVLFSLFPD